MFRHSTANKLVQQNIMINDIKCFGKVNEQNSNNILAKVKFMKRKKTLTSKMNLDLRKWIVKCLVWSVVLYAAKTWTISKTDMKRIEAFEMWIWRKIEKISWSAKVSNFEVLNRVKENRYIINTINQRKRRWLGHVLRHYVLLRDILEGRMTGKRTRGRKRQQLMSNICEGYETAKNRAEDRCLWCVSVMGVIDLLLQQNTRRRRRTRQLTRQFDRSSLCCRLPSANDCTSCCSWLIYKMQPLSNLPSNNDVQLTN